MKPTLLRTNHDGLVAWLAPFEPSNPRLFLGHCDCRPPRTAAEVPLDCSDTDALMPEYGEEADL